MGMPIPAANSFLLHLYNNQAWANNGDATGFPAAGTVGNYYIALHTADPGTGGNQSTNEASNAGYARAAVPRSSAGWTVTNNVAANTAQVLFNTITGGSSTATYFSIGLLSSGAGQILASGPLSPNIPLSNGATPVVPVGAITHTVT